MRFSALVLLLAASAAAQIPDTTSAWRYAPLAVGDVWEYESWIETCQGPNICTREQVG